MKTCSLCGEYRPQEEFYSHPRTKDGLQSQCKRCIDVSKKVRLSTFRKVANDQPVENAMETAGVVIAEVL